MPGTSQVIPGAHLVELDAHAEPWLTALPGLVADGILAPVPPSASTVVHDDRPCCGAVSISGSATPQHVRNLRLAWRALRWTGDPMACFVRVHGRLYGSEPSERITRRWLDAIAERTACCEPATFTALIARHPELLDRHLRPWPAEPVR